MHVASQRTSKWATDILVRALPVAASLAFGAAFVIWVSRVYGLRNAIVIDDAFITYRYAENLAAGHGAVWNPGAAPVEGYSTPLYMALLAAGSFVTSIEGVSRALGVFSTLAMVGATSLWTFQKTRSFVAGACAAALLLAHPFTSVWAVGGMETPMYAALLMAALVVAERFFRSPGRRSAAGLALCLAALGLVRTEGLIFTFAFIGTLFTVPRGTPEVRRFGLRVAAASLAIVGLHVLCRLAYYGLLLPVPAYQKGKELLAGWDYVRETVEAYWPFVALCLAGAFAAPTADGKRSASRAGVFGLLCVLALGAVITNTEPLMTPYHRYLFPLLPVLFGFSAVALARLLRKRENWAIVGVFATLVVLADGEAALGAKYEPVARELESDTIALRESHLGVARWLAENMAEGEVVALGDCGIIPYYSGVRVLDLFGLNDYEVARTWENHRLTQAGVDYVFEQDPDVVVLTPLALDDALEQDPRFEERYRFERLQRGYYTMGIFVRREGDGA